MGTLGTLRGHLSTHVGARLAGDYIGGSHMGYSRTHVNKRLLARVPDQVRVERLDAPQAATPLLQRHSVRQHRPDRTSPSVAPNGPPDGRRAIESMCRYVCFHVRMYVHVGMYVCMCM
jgi:hypothetical protein